MTMVQLEGLIVALLAPLVFVLLLLGVLTWALSRLPAPGRDIAWLAGGTIPADAQAAEVYRRYLVRHRAHRMIGGICGIALAITYGITWQGSVELGIGRGSPLGDLLFCGVAGVLIGALSAETYRLSERRSARAVATLAAHPPLARPDLVLSARVAAGIGLLIGLIVLVAGGGPVSLAVALGGSVLVVIGELTRRAVDGRRRPVLSDAAVEVDARIRAFASTTVARLELAAGVLAAGWALSESVPDDLGGALGALAVVGVLTVLVVVVVQLHRAAPRPPRSFVALPQVGVVA